MRDERLIENLLGEGLVTTDAGGQIGTRRYAFQHSRVAQITTSINGVKTENEVGRRMAGATHWLPDDNVGRHHGETWAITLTDGRRRSFLITNSRGDIAFTGPCA